MCFFLCLLFFSASSLAHVEIRSSNAILINAETGVVLFEKEADQVCYPASITKIATALHVLDRLSLDQIVEVSEASLRMRPTHKHPEKVPSYWLDVEGTSFGVHKGERLSVEALLHGMLLASGNDAANVLAESTSGSISQFMEDLNQALRKIGCTNTHFSNPHGLHHEEHATTARDMALITAHALKKDSFCAIVGKRSYHTPRTNKNKEREIKQSNRLLQEGPFFYSKALGVKTGFTSRAKHTLVAAAEHAHRRLIAVLLGSETREDRYLDAITLFETAFAEQKTRYVIVNPSSRYTKQIEGARNLLKARVAEELAIEQYPAERSPLKAEIVWRVPPLPIKKGDPVGEIRLYENGRILQSVPLIAVKKVHRSWSYFMRQFLSSVVYIPKQPEESVFDCVSFSTKCVFSLAPCLWAMVARSEHEFVELPCQNPDSSGCFGIHKKPLL